MVYLDDHTYILELTEKRSGGEQRFSLDPRAAARMFRDTNKHGVLWAFKLGYPL
jgi:hypothetical protein